MSITVLAPALPSLHPAQTHGGAGRRRRRTGGAASALDRYSDRMNIS